MELNQQPVIFVVEDNLIYQSLIAKELESIGGDIHFYTNGEACLNELDKKPSVIVMDYNLEGEMNGLDTLQQVRNTNPDVYVILFSSQIYHRDLPIEEYIIPHFKHPYVSIYTSRGCPARCIFCLWPQTYTGQKMRTRSPENVTRHRSRSDPPASA